MSHAPLAPSSAARWLACPGSVALSAGLPVQGDDDYSGEGDLAHEEAAIALRRGASCFDRVGARSEDGKHELTSEMAAHLERYLTYIRGIELLESATLYVEQQVHFRDPSTSLPVQDCWGTADAILVAGPKLYVVDLKFGAGVLVSPFDNPQELIYALGAVDTVEDLGHENIEEITLVIHQPRRSEDPQEWTITRAELEEFRLKVLQGIWNTKQAGAPLVAGDHCQFCPKITGCPKLHGDVVEGLPEVFTERSVAVVAEPPAPATIATADLGRIMQMADKIRQWLRIVAQEAENRANMGETVPGFKLVNAIGNRAWTDSGAVVKTLQKVGHNPYDEPSVLSPAKVEKLLGKKITEQLLGSYITRPDKGTTLVPESDRRPAAQAAATVFDALPADQ